MITVTAYGESALLINFEQRIDRRVQGKVVVLRDMLADLAGIRYMIPAYCSLTVVFDRSVVDAGHLREYILNIEEHVLAEEPANTGVLHTIPVCYEEAYALDAQDVVDQTGQSWEKVIETHLATEFYVYMLGFVPGFAYMGDMPAKFFCKRRSVPRTAVPAGSVGLAGLQSAIYPFDSPGGWQIIGRTPLKLFDPALERPNLLRAADRVRFERISASAIENQAVRS